MAQKKNRRKGTSSIYKHGKHFYLKANNIMKYPLITFLRFQKKWRYFIFDLRARLKDIM